MITLRTYQQSGVNSIREAMRQGVKRVLFQSPTGSGKTVVFAHIAQSAVSKNKRVWIVVHRAELLSQASRKLTEIGVDHGIIKSGFESDDTHLVQVASVQTLVNRLDKIKKPELIIYDEAQHSTSGTYQKITQWACESYILGVTATPCRADGKGLGEVFQCLILGASVQRLMDEWYLSKAKYYAPPVKADLSKLRTTAGDYNKQDIEMQFNRPCITGDAVATYRKLSDGLPAIAFCVSVKHAEDTAQAFVDAGYKSASIDGTMTTERRSELLQGLANGSIQVLTSCELIGEGVDVPCLNTAILLRPTQSLSLHLQMIGRALRIYKGKTHAIILDHVGNLLRHGLAEDVREWSLMGIDKKTKDKQKDAGYKQCPKCYCVNRAGSKQCSECQTEFETQQRIIETNEGELQEFIAKKQQQNERKQAKTMNQLIQLARERGYKNPVFWARKVLEGRGR